MSFSIGPKFILLLRRYRTSKISFKKIFASIPPFISSLNILSDSFSGKYKDKSNFINDLFEKEQSSKGNKSFDNSNYYAVNRKSFSDDIKLMQEFVEFKYFKKVMKQNNNFFE